MKQVPIARSQILVTATLNLVAQATWYPGFVHPCNTVFLYKHTELAYMLVI